MGAFAPLTVLEVIGGLAIGVITLAILATVARRLLGLQVGWLRTLVAAAVGYTVSAFVSSATDAPEEPVLFLTVLLGIALLVAMVFIVLGEAIVPSGTPVHPIQALRRRLGRTRRYLQITRIAVRHGLGPYLRGRGQPRADPERSRELARSLRLAFEEGGVTFVKLGQVLSTRPDLIPPELVEELSRLQERAAPAPWPEVRGELDDEFAELDSTFAEIDSEPLAAASIAQVHRARLRLGEHVVVKVQRPGIVPVVERDLDIVLRLATAVETRQRRGVAAHETIAARRSGVNAVALADGFAQAIREELDFRVEARNIAAVTAAAHARGGDDQVRLPVVHEQLAGPRVRVLGYLDGIPVGAAAGEIERRGLNRHALARDLLSCMLDQVMVDGVFHADPHPGNVILMREGGLALLDFGSVGRLDPLARAALQDFLSAVDRGDPEALRDALLELAGAPDDVDEQLLSRDIGRFMVRHLTPGVPPSAAVFTDLSGSSPGTASRFRPMSPRSSARSRRSREPSRFSIPTSTWSPRRAPSPQSASGPKPCRRRSATSCSRRCP